jgi:hypothetical protein
LSLRIQSARGSDLAVSRTVLLMREINRVCIESGYPLMHVKARQDAMEVTLLRDDDRLVVRVDASKGCHIPS